MPEKKQAALPYPNPIKLLSRGERQKEIKGEYLNAEMMHQGVALPISDIRPDNNIESEIFPPELTREAQNKEVFTPPNHKQMRFLQDGEKQDEPIDDPGSQFFITEEIPPPKKTVPIREEVEDELDQPKFKVSDEV